MRKRSLFLITILFSLLISSCKYDFILPTEVPPQTGPVLFATQVAPIFSTGNKCTACHNTGGTAPDLTASKAYASIVPSLINTATPASSLIYSFPAPTTTTHSWKKLTAGEAALILTWITEGAKNN
ncbi:MAG TPA: hypothetical protein VGK38_13475 [Prolixibacteraceae bacterium]|jgi:hypothetical protein